MELTTIFVYFSASDPNDLRDRYYSEQMKTLVDDIHGLSGCEGVSTHQFSDRAEVHIECRYTFADKIKHQIAHWRMASH